MNGKNRESLQYRENIWHDKFVNIAVDRFNQADNAYVELMGSDKEWPGPEEHKLFNKVQENCIETIIFSVMAMESYINLIAAVYISDNFSEAIDRLDVVNKWVAVMQYKTGVEPSRGEQPLQGIAKTVKQRNKIMHTKSKGFRPEPDGSIHFPQVRLKADYMKPAYEGLMTIKQIKAWVEKKIPEDTVTFCEENILDTIHEQFNKVEDTWMFSNNMMLI